MKEETTLKSTKRGFISITPQELDKLVCNAEGTSEECCGFLLGHDRGIKSVKQIIPARNVAFSDRHLRFEVDPLEYLRAEKFAAAARMDLLGIYHSHPEAPAVPSETDRLNAQACFSYVILSVCGRHVTEIRSWRLNHLHQFEEETFIL